MKRSVASLLVLGLLALVLASCGSAASGQQSTLTTATARPTQHAAGPKGRLAWQGFLDPNQNTAAIFSANADGSDVRQLTHPGYQIQDAYPAWSPDGSSLLLTTSNTPTGASYIAIMHADGSGLRELGTCTGECLGQEAAAWSPDGTQIAFNEALGPQRPDGSPRVSAIWMMQADGSHTVQFTRPPGSDFSDDQPAWSPDGKWLVFARTDNRPAEPMGKQALFLIKRDGTGLKQLTPWELDAGMAHWSPDGKRILFQSFGSYPPGSTPQLYTIFPDGTHLLQLTTNERNSWPAWSPDGTQIIFGHRSTTGADQNGHLFEMNADGSGLVQITHNPFWQLQPTWSSAP